MLCPIHVFRPELYARDPVAKPVNHRIHNLLLREFVFLAWLLDFWVILREYRSTDILHLWALRRPMSFSESPVYRMVYCGCKKNQKKSCNPLVRYLFG